MKVEVRCRCLIRWRQIRDEELVYGEHNWRDSFSDKQSRMSFCRSSRPGNIITMRRKEALELRNKLVTR